MTSQIQKSNPYVSVVVKKTDIPFIIRGFNNACPNVMEKLVLEDHDTLGYLQRTFENTETELVRIQFHMEEEYPILMHSIKKNQFFTGSYQHEITHSSAETLPELLSALEQQYKHQITAKKIQLH